VHSASAGVNHLLFPALVGAGECVTLTNARGVYSASLAEWALFGAAYFAKDLPRLRAQQADARWEPYDVRQRCGATAHTRACAHSRCHRRWRSCAGARWASSVLETSGAPPRGWRVRTGCASQRCAAAARSPRRTTRLRRATRRCRRSTWRG
jgi:hypothetical protein